MSRAWDGTLAGAPLLTLPAGRRLHHGTDCEGDFEVPDGPAWFGRTRSTAAYWAGWNVPPDGRRDGPRRTLSYVTTRDVALFDLDRAVRTDDDWLELCLAATGIDDDVDERIVLARALAGHGFAGWIGQGEVMLTGPSGILRLVSVRPVEGANPMRPRPSTYAPTTSQPARVSWPGSAAAA